MKDWLGVSQTLSEEKRSRYNNAKRKGRKASRCRSKEKLTVSQICDRNDNRKQSENRVQRRV